MASYNVEMGEKNENKHRHLLLVDDDPDFTRLVKLALENEGYTVTAVNSGEKALAAMTSQRPHLVLLDVNMPGINGLETLRFLRNSSEYISALFVSARSEEEDVIRGLDAGADDYICKPVRPKELLSRVRAHLRIKDIRDELKRANSRLKELVDIDDLTGLYNMRSLYDKLDNELRRAQRYGRSVCAIMMDMDHFKSVNDENDHLFGSFVLKEVGQIIKDNVRQIDIAARYGGDEFLVVLTEIELEGALAFAERLRQSIGGHDFSNDGYHRSMSSSIGLALSERGSSHVDARTLVRYADRALYDAKEAGRNCVRYRLDGDSSDQNRSERPTIPWRKNKPA